MIENLLSGWTVLLFLGALHGVNPGMGWLFGVALAIQEESGRAVWRALAPLAVGHALAVAAAVVAAAAVGLVVPLEVLRWLVAGALFGMGILHLRRHWHPRGGGMQVGARDLVLWSFLMASAHGAGLMALPFVPSLSVTGTGEVVAAEPTEPAGFGAASHPASSEGHMVDRPNVATPVVAHLGHPAGHAGTGTAGRGLLAILVHTLGYLLATGTVASIVYHRLGVGVLRKGWVNIDLIWAASLIVTAVLVPLV